VADSFRISGVNNYELDFANRLDVSGFLFWFPPDLWWERGVAPPPPEDKKKPDSAPSAVCSFLRRNGDHDGCGLPVGRQGKPREDGRPAGPEGPKGDGDRRRLSPIRLQKKINRNALRGKSKHCMQLHRCSHKRLKWCLLPVRGTGTSWLSQALVIRWCLTQFTCRCRCTFGKGRKF